MVRGARYFGPFLAGIAGVGIGIEMPNRPAAGQGKEIVAESVETPLLVVAHAGGRCSASLLTKDDGIFFTMRNSKQRLRLAMGLEANGDVILQMFDSAGTMDVAIRQTASGAALMQLGAAGQDPTLHIGAQGGAALVQVQGSKKTIRTWMGLETDGEAWHGTASENGASLCIGASEGKVALIASDSEERPRLFVEAEKDGAAGIGTRDSMLQARTGAVATLEGAAALLVLNATGEKLFFAGVDKDGNEVAGAGADPGVGK